VLLEETCILICLGRYEHINPSRRPKFRPFGKLNSRTNYDLNSLFTPLNSIWLYWNPDVTLMGLRAAINLVCVKNTKEPLPDCKSIGTAAGVASVEALFPSAGYALFVMDTRGGPPRPEDTR
jgi:hypothetical protein